MTRRPVAGERAVNASPDIRRVRTVSGHPATRGSTPGQRAEPAERVRAGGARPRRPAPLAGADDVGDEDLALGHLVVARPRRRPRRPRPRPAASRSSQRGELVEQRRQHRAVAAQRRRRRRARGAGAGACARSSRRLGIPLLAQSPSLVRSGARPARAYGRRVSAQRTERRADQPGARRMPRAAARARRRVPAGGGRAGAACRRRRASRRGRRRGRAGRGRAARCRGVPACVGADERRAAGRGRGRSRGASCGARRRRARRTSSISLTSAPAAAGDLGRPVAHLLVAGLPGAVEDVYARTGQRAPEAHVERRSPPASRATAATGQSSPGSSLPLAQDQSS